MDFDQLMEFIGADEEMGKMELYMNDAVLSIKWIAGKKFLNIHFFEQCEDGYVILKEVLNDNGVKYETTFDLELGLEESTVEAEVDCSFLLDMDEDSYSEESDSTAANNYHFIELIQAWADLQIVRKRGKKKIKLSFFVEFKEYNILKSFFNCIWSNYSEEQDKFFGTYLKVAVDVRCSFSPMKASSDDRKQA